MENKGDTSNNNAIVNKISIDVTSIEVISMDDGFVKIIVPANLYQYFSSCAITTRTLADQFIKNTSQGAMYGTKYELTLLKEVYEQIIAANKAKEAKEAKESKASEDYTPEL